MCYVWIARTMLYVLTMKRKQNKRDSNLNFQIPTDKPVQTQTMPNTDKPARTQTMEIKRSVM